jgi:hypothetical protein
LVAALPIDQVWAAELGDTSVKAAAVQVFDPTTPKLVATVTADKAARDVT